MGVTIQCPAQVPWEADALAGSILGGPLCNLNVVGAIAIGESLSHVVPQRWLELPWPPHRLCSVAAQEPRGDGAAV